MFLDPEMCKKTWRKTSISSECGGNAPSRQYKLSMRNKVEESFESM